MDRAQSTGWGAGSAAAQADSGVGTGEMAMYLGQFYIDWSTGPQFAMAAGAVLSLFVGSGVVLVAALRAVLKGWLPSAAALSATAAFIPIATIMTLAVGPYFDQMWNWLVYQSSWFGGSPYSYGYAYAYQSTIPWRPDFSVLYYGIPTGHSLAMGGAAVALGLMGISANLLIPLHRGVAFTRDVDAHTPGPQ
ncbi:MAG: hypothetical protein ACJAZO_001000 [Myxococcota bacterium]|jgi:hypothetical protein